MPQISASVNQLTVIKIKEMAAKEKRSFSEMVDILLGKATYHYKPAKSSTK